MCEWLLRMVPYSITPTHHPKGKPANDVVSYDDMPLPSPPPPSFTNQQRVQMIALITNNLMDLVNPNSEVYILAAQIPHIVRGGPV